MRITADPGFPYERYKEDRLWAIMHESMAELVENGDLVETTGRDYIVGFLCKRVQDAFPTVATE